MGESRRVLELRKDLLRARCSLQRLRLARAAGDVRESLSAPRAIAAFAASTMGRSLVVAVLLGLTARRRTSRLLRAAAIAAVALIGRAFRGVRPPAAPDPEREPAGRAAGS